MTDVGPVSDRRSEHRFVLETGGETAELDYSVNSRRLVIEHTFVPEPLRHRAIGGALVRAAVERARADGLTVVPHCSFARAWLHRHPEIDVRVAPSEGREGRAETP